MRRAFTLVEMVVAVAIGAIGLAIGMTAVALLVKSERSSDRESSRALVESRLMQTLLQDVRSSSAVTAVVPDKEFRIDRWVLNGTAMTSVAVTWRIEASGSRVTRTSAGAIDSFEFTGLMDPGKLFLRLSIRRVDDVKFVAAP